MWPKANNVLEEFYYHWCRKRGVRVCVCVFASGGHKHTIAPHFFDLGGGGGGNGMFVPPHFYFPLELYVYITLIKQLFDIFHIPINYLVDNFNKLIQMAVIK